MRSNRNGWCARALCAAAALILLLTAVSAGVFAAAETASIDAAGEKGTLTLRAEILHSVDGVWVAAEQVRPGEAVKARIYLDTDYPTAAGKVLFFYDNAVFADSYTANRYLDLGPVTGVTSGKDPVSGQNADSIETVYIYKMDANNANIKRMKQKGTLTDAFLADHTPLVVDFWLAQDNDRVALLDGSAPICDFDLTVRSDAVPGTVGRVYPDLDHVFTPSHAQGGLTDVSYGETYQMGVDSWGDAIYSVRSLTMAGVATDVIATNTPVTVVGAQQTRETRFYLGDPADPSAAGSLYTITYSQAGEAAVLPAEPTMSGWRFAGWEALTAAQDGSAFVARWEQMPAAAGTYTVARFVMNPDGTYPAAPDVETVVDAAPGTYSAFAGAPEGFALDPSMPNADTVTVYADGSTSGNAVLYLMRQRYDLYYHFIDAAGNSYDDYAVRYGAPLPAFGAGVNGKPVRRGYTFVGWSTEKDNAAAIIDPGSITMPAARLRLYAIYEPITYRYTFDAGDGSFADGTSVAQFEYHYNDVPALPEPPTCPGGTFLEWDLALPAKVTGDLSFEAIYEWTDYTLVFLDADGGIAASYILYYGDVVSESFAPAGYGGGWINQATGSPAAFPFRMTGNTVLRAQAEETYSARFYSEGRLYAETMNAANTEISVPEPPVREGYTFLMWDPEPGLQEPETMEFTAVWEQNAPTHLPGDINGDGKVNSKDLTRLMKYLAGDEVEVVYADVTGDGKVNSKDLTRLMKYLAGEEVELF